MAWVFIAITLGALAFTVRIVVDHTHEAQRLRDQVFALKAERDRLEELVEEHRMRADEAKAQSGKIKQAIGERERAIKDLQAQIEKQKGEMERRGKYRIG